MKKRICWLISILINIITVTSTIVFMFINFENIAYYTVGFDFVSAKSLHARYYYWLQDIFGKEKGFEMYWKIVDFTIHIIKQNVNLKCFFAISIMMAVGLLVDRIVREKTNRKLMVYYFICFIIMLSATFSAGPFYIDSIYDE